MVVQQCHYHRAGSVSDSRTADLRKVFHNPAPALCHQLRKARLLAGLAVVVVRVPASIHKLLLLHPISTFLWAAECRRTIRSLRLAIHRLLPQPLAVMRALSLVYLLRFRDLRAQTPCSRSTKTQKTLSLQPTRHSCNRTIRLTPTINIIRTTSSHSRKQRGAVSSVKRLINNSRHPHNPVHLDS